MNLDPEMFINTVSVLQALVFWLKVIAWCWIVTAGSGLLLAWMTYFKFRDNQRHAWVGAMLVGGFNQIVSLVKNAVDSRTKAHGEDEAGRKAGDGAKV